MTIDPTDPLAAARRDILEAALRHVPFDGWTRAALEGGAADAGHDPTMLARAFPRGPIDVIEAFNDRADRAMVAALEQQGAEEMRVRDRIATAVRARLEQNAEHREAIRRGAALLARPGNAATGARILYRTVDAIWRAAGDTATDFNFYTKRGLLTGVYASTVLYWLDDRSADFGATWRFLDRRIDEVMRIGRGLGRLAGRLGDLPSPLRRPRRRYG